MHANASAADIADAFAAESDPDRESALRRLLYLGARASGAEHLSLYWDVRSAVERIDAAGLRDEREPPAVWLSERLWPWLRDRTVAPTEPVLLAEAPATPAPFDRRRTAAILPLLDTEPRIAGLLYFEFQPPSREHFLEAWRDHAIGYAELVQSWLHSELDADTGVLSAEAFRHEIHRWTATADQRRRQAVVLRLRFAFLTEVERRHGTGFAVEALRELKQLVRSRMRQRDLLGRTGRHSFGLLLRHCSSSDAERAADTLTRMLRHYRFRSAPIGFEPEFSIDLRPLRGGSDPDEAEPPAGRHDPGSTGSNAESVYARPDGRRQGDGRRSGGVPPVDRRQGVLPLDASVPSAGRDAYNVVSLDTRRKPSRAGDATATDRVSSAPGPGSAPRLQRPRVQPCIRLDRSDAELFLRLRGSARHGSDGVATLDLDGSRRLASALEIVRIHASGSGRTPWLLPLPERCLRMATLDAIVDGCAASGLPRSRLLFGVSSGRYAQLVDSDPRFPARLRATGLEFLVDAARDPIDDVRRLTLAGSAVWGVAVSARHIARRTGREAAMDTLAAQVVRLRRAGLRVVCGGIDTQAVRRFCTQLGVEGGWGRSCAGTRSVDLPR